MTVKFSLLAAASLLACTSAASAAPTLYTGDDGRITFIAATTGGTMSVEGFEGITTPTSGGIGVVSYGATFARDGLSITGSYNNTPVTLSVLDNTYLNGGKQVQKRFGVAAGAILDDGYGDLTFNFATPVNAFGVDIATIARGIIGASSGAFVLTVDGSSYTYNYSNTAATVGFGFLGITTDTPFSSLTIKTSNTFDSELNDVRFGTLAAATPAVPEPATWALMVLGFGAVGGALRRRPAVTRVRYA